MQNFDKYQKLNGEKFSRYVNAFISYVPAHIASNPNTAELSILMNARHAIASSKIAKIERFKKLNNNRLNCNRIEQI